jgi:hypothetical protein
LLSNKKLHDEKLYLTKDKPENIYIDFRKHLDEIKSNEPEEYWIKNVDIYCDILEHVLSFIRKVDKDQRIKDENIKELSIGSFRGGLGSVVTLLEYVYNFPTYSIVENLWSRIGTTEYIKDKISPTEKLRVFKEHLNGEYEQYCRNRIVKTNKIKIEGQPERSNIYCEILNVFFEEIEYIEDEEIQDSVKILLMDYFYYGLSTMLLIPGIEKITTSDIDKIDFLRKEINRINHIREINPSEIWLSFIEYLHKEYTKNCVIKESITSKEVRSLSIKGFTFPIDLIEKMRDSVTESNNKRQKVEFKLCAKDNIVYAENFCEGSIGYFRVIPEIKYPRLTIEDIKFALNSIVCLGGINQIYCFIRKGEYNEALNKLQDINNKTKKLEEIVKKYEQGKSEFLDRDIRSGNMEVIDIPLDIDKLKKYLELVNLPGIRLGQYILPINVVQRMKDIIIEGEESGTEIAYDLCADKNNVIKATNKIRWEEARYVVPVAQCGINETLVGSFHTHSHAELKVDPSLPDLLSTFGKLMCIGARTEIKCFLRHNFNEGDREYLKSLINIIPDEFLKLDKERSEFLEKYFEFIKLI